MKLKKRVTPAVIEANCKNSTKSTGPRSERGKFVVSQNPVKHSVYSKNLVFKNEDESVAFTGVFKQLRHEIGSDDLTSQMTAWMLAVEHLRYARSLRQDQRIVKGHSPGNEALEAIHNSELLHLSNFDSGDTNTWQCGEVSVSAQEGRQIQNKNGTAAAGSGNDQQVELRAKFVNPADSVLRCQSAAERRYYKALREFQRIQKQNQRRKRIAREEKLLAEMEGK